MVVVGCREVRVHDWAEGRKLVLHLADRELERLHPSDHQETLNIVLGTKMEPTVAAGGPSDEPDLVVVTGGNRKLGTLGHSVDVHLGGALLFVDHRRLPVLHSPLSCRRLFGYLDEV